MRSLMSLFLIISFVLGLSGCQTVNRGLDKVNEGAYEAGKPIGKVMSIPGSVAEGGAEGVIATGDEDNPYNR
jgi:hypothetical protein